MTLRDEMRSVPIAKLMHNLQKREKRQLKIPKTKQVLLLEAVLWNEEQKKQQN